MQQGVFKFFDYPMMDYFPSIKPADLKTQKITPFLHYFSDLLPFEDFLFIYFWMLNERNIIFISTDQQVLSSSISFFMQLLHPFVWCYPLIFNLPRECFVVLSSPVPIIVGLNLQKQQVFNEIIPNYCELKQFNLFVFLDEGTVYTQNKDEKSLIIPSFNKFTSNVGKFYKQHFSGAKSKSVKLKKDKHGNEHFEYIQRQKNFSQTKSSLRSFKPKETIQKKSKNHGEMALILNFFENLNEKFIIQESEKLRTNNTNHLHFHNSTNFQFLKNINRTQFVTYHYEQSQTSRDFN